MRLKTDSTDLKFSKVLTSKLRRLQSIFPGKIVIGGSSVYSQVLGHANYQWGDVDLYLDVEMSTEGFIDILTDVIFREHHIKVTTNTSGATPRYDMPSITKVIKVDFPNKECDSLDFIFVRVGDNTEWKDTLSWYMDNQAYNVTQFAAQLNYSTKGYTLFAGMDSLGFLSGDEIKATGKPSTEEHNRKMEKLALAEILKTC